MSQHSSESLEREIIANAVPPRKNFSLSALLGVLGDFSAVALLGVSMWLIVRSSEQPPILYLTFAVVGVRAFAIGRAAFRYGERLTSHDAAFRQLSKLRVSFYERLLPIAPAGLQKTGRGDLMSRVVRDVDELQNYPLRVLQPLIMSGTVLTLSVVLVCFISLPAGLVLAVCLAVSSVLALGANRAVSARAEKEISRLRGRLADIILDTLAALSVLTVFGALEERLALVSQADAELRAAERRRAVGAGVAAAIVSLLAGLATVGAVLVTADSVAAGVLNAPLFAAAVLVPAAVFEVFGAVPVALASRREVQASAHRLATAVPERIPEGIPADTSTETLPQLPLTDSLLELQGVSAHHPGEDTPVLRDVTFSVMAGDRILIEGASGAGKSTLAQVLVRFVDYKGSYRVRGVEAQHLAQSAVRGVVGLCEQQPHLFDNDIRQNLLFAKPDATEDELLDVLERVGLAEWAAERGGLAARVGESGALVSGGQAQRIALARALLAGFPVIVFDEPTANVDPDRADRLVSDILGLARESGRAVIIISHTPVPSEGLTATLRLSGGRVLVK
ncbi:thiol reductant ABC exporter subunit CydC [Lysinibacter sp. HNR]|uniref:thiol reductant ABC exporter subunit CydC n=1 Tax=Lysinibacter sp. HNR TaxID=3031408 RepID=UPI00243505BC|nr:thiol reductant ABC exporter subunit CydC [Lysinibacter sp. HNR]WGD36417.1 thiol reductant ABC exporter subunit CydC [Lysinibacter sp. HNR]